MRALASERALEVARLQLERDRGVADGGSAAAELAERELSVLRAQLEAAGRDRQSQLDAQAAAFSAELARARAEASCEQWQLQAATVQALQAAASAGLSGRLAGSMGSGGAPGVPPAAADTARVARAAEIKKLIAEAAAQLPPEHEQQHQPTQRLRASQPPRTTERPRRVPPTTKQQGR